MPNVGYGKNKFNLLTLKLSILINKNKAYEKALFTLYLTSVHWL